MDAAVFYVTVAVGHAGGKEQRLQQLHVDAAEVPVADIGGEEFKEAIGRARAGDGDQRREVCCRRRERGRSWPHDLVPVDVKAGRLKLPAKGLSPSS